MAFAVSEIVLNMGEEVNRNNSNANSLNAAFTFFHRMNGNEPRSDTQKELLFTTKSFPGESESRTFVPCFS